MKKDMSGGIIHCFSYSREIAEEYLKMGLYLGIGGVLTFKNAKKLKEVAKIAPLSQIVLETDCPYMSPELPGKEKFFSESVLCGRCSGKDKGNHSRRGDRSD